MIRIITPPDREGILRLLRAARVFRDDELPVAAELVDTFLERGPASGYEAYCRDVGTIRPAGFICFGPVPLTERSFDLYWLAVDPRAGRRGLGTELVKYSETAVAHRGGGSLYIETSSTPLYKTARTFYEKRGFVREALLRDFYRPGDHKIIFVKRIPHTE